MAKKRRRGLKGALGSRPSWSLGAGLVLIGCTTLAGIDDDYIREAPLESGGASGDGPDSSAGTGALGMGGSAGLLGSSGAAGEGGSLGVAGRGGTSGTGSGGTSGAGGTDGTGGSSGGDAGCAPGQKFCSTDAGGQCTEPRPIVGCSLANCEPCEAPPPNASVVCKASACDFECDPNYQRSSNECVPIGTGGTAGTGGAGGSSGSAGASGSGGTTCVANQCPTCSPLGPFRCCLGSRCGCSWAPTAYCFPG